MARRLILKWTEEAANDIVAIAKFISQDSEFYAKAVIQKIMDKVATIPDASEIGRIVPEFERPDLRERFVYSYRIIYKITKNAIWIIAIFPGKQPLNTLLSDRLET